MVESKNNSNWNIETLKQYVESRLTTMDKAVDVALNTLNNRLMGMNEFRDTIEDQASKFVTRQELQALLKSIESDIKVLTASKNLLEGKANMSSVYIAYIFAILGVILGIIGLFL